MKQLNQTLVQPALTWLIKEAKGESEHLKEELQLSLEQQRDTVRG